MREIFDPRESPRNTAIIAGVEVLGGSALPKMEVLGGSALDSRAGSPCAPCVE